MHVIMSCIGTYGDVLPHIAVGATLASRGHEVQFLTSEYFKPQVEAAGLPFTSVMSAERYLAGVRDPAVWQQKTAFRASWKHFAPCMAAGFAALSRHVRPGVSVLTGSTMSFWVRIAQEKFGNPAATLHLSPVFLLSAEDPPDIFPALTRLPPVLRRAALRLTERLLSDPVMAPEVNRLRARVDLAPVRSIALRWMHAPDRVICAFPDWFGPPARDWPANAVCTGFIRGAQASEKLDAALQDFLAAGSAPLVFTPGSGHGSSAVFFARGLAACAALGRRAVLVTGFRDQLPETLPDFAHYAAFTNFGQLAPRAAAFVHPGGVGTTGLLFETATPQLFTPFMADQKDTAARATRLGVGLRIRPDAPVTAWIEALSRLLNDPAIAQACTAIATRSRMAPPGRELAADWIELLARATPSRRISA